MCSLNILCVIPARSGSKGLPNKNIRLYKNKPLLSYSILQAKHCKYSKNMRIIVSTDSEQYAKIARNYGAETPFLRPKRISGDLSTDYECIKHTVDWLQNEEKYYPDIIIHLRPTQPCRKIQDINKTIDIFIQNRTNYDSLRSVIPVNKSPYKMYTISNNTLEPLFKDLNGLKEPFNMARQMLPNAYLHNGYIDIFNANILNQKTISGTRILPYVMEDNDNIDIDYEDDLYKYNIIS